MGAGNEEEESFPAPLYTHTVFGAVYALAHHNRKFELCGGQRAKSPFTFFPSSYEKWQWNLDLQTSKLGMNNKKSIDWKAIIDNAYPFYLDTKSSLARRWWRLNHQARRQMRAKPNHQEQPSSWYIFLSRDERRGNFAPSVWRKGGDDSRNIGQQ
ncbi:hypothetical protein BDZ89DRAFT_1212120 [Hymenopellis radicata]|nr:hypothetical protein BDZ89DRAFT_1212120 [Hymenopellis radicata]